MEDMLKSVRIPTVIVISFMMMNTVAVTTDNRVILSGVLVGSALAASQCKYWTFKEFNFVQNFPCPLWKTHRIIIV